MKKFQSMVFAFCLLFMATDVFAGYITEESKFVYPNYSKRISMDFNEAALSDVLKIFSQQSGMNFIASSDLNDKKVTLFFDNIPVEEALEKILTANGLQYEIQQGSDIFVVKPIPEEGKVLVTRIFKLKNASVPSSKINSTISIQSGESSSASAASSSGSAGGAGGILSAVRGVLSPYGKIMEDPRTNSLIITDIESQFADIESLIARLDVAVPQILIEVEMLDVSKNTTDVIGVKFADKLAEITGVSQPTNFPWDIQKLFEFNREDYTAGVLNTGLSKHIIQFLETKSDTRNLARPRIITLDNQTAEIKISTDEAIGIVAQTTSGDGGTSESTKEAERVETGVFLLVTPQANLLNGEITLAIAPRVIEARTGGTFEGITFFDPEERGSQQIMKVKNGETIVVGGLLRTEDKVTISKLPVLGDIPLVGRAFRHKDKKKEERELLIFITPSIVAEGGVQKMKSSSDKNFVREQEVSKQKMKQIEKDLKSIERQKY